MKLDDHPAVKRHRERAGKDSAPPGPEKLDPEWLKRVLLEAGADDAGLAHVGRLESEEEKAEILEVFPGAKSILGFVCRLNPENIRCVSRGVSDLEFRQVFEKVNSVAHRAALSLGRGGVRALSPPAGFPMDLAKWPGKMWPLSHKPAAVACGLGAMGRHRMVIHPRFGSSVLLGALLLDREAAAYDRPVDVNPCIGCGLCASVCPVGAIGPEGRFNFTACIAHNYRDRLGGFLDWVERVVSSPDIRSYRGKVSDPETVSMWQSLSYGICNKSSYCMAVCPAGEEVIGPFLDRRKEYLAGVVQPLQRRKETVYVVPGSDAEGHAARHFPHKAIKRVGTGLRPASAGGFLKSLPLVFQPGRSEGVDSTYHFTFTGAEECRGTVVIRDRRLQVLEGHVGKADLRLTADSQTWVGFLAKERSLPWALLRGKIRLKGSPRLLKQFARCFPS